MRHFVSLGRFDCSWEDHVLRRWTEGRGDGTGGEADAGLSEYVHARRFICLDSSLMRESRVGRTLIYLQQERRRRAGSHGHQTFRGTVADVVADFHDVFEPSLLLALKKAFGHRTDVAARNEDRPVPVVAAHRGNFFDAAVTMWASLPVWKKPVMSSALRELLVTEDRTGLQVVLGMVKASLRHCEAGKVDVWSRLLLRIAPPERTGGPACGAPAAAGLGSNSGLAARRREARSRLWDVAFAFADDWKERAFSTVFLEPTKMYYLACGDSELADNVEVHGASVYLAVLLSTLGVWCPRLPFLLDTPIAAVSFLDALDGNQLRALWRPANFGKPFRSVPECAVPRVRGQVANHWSSFIFNGRQPWQIANNAVDVDGPEERRQKLQPYLLQFAKYFSIDILVPRLTQHLLERDDTCAALQVLLDEFREAEPAAVQAGGPDEGDVRFWLWDLEVLPAVLRLERAVQLLQFAGLVRRDAVRASTTAGT